MGNECFNEFPNDRYAAQLDLQHQVQLCDKWETVKEYAIKKIFLKHTSSLANSSEKVLSQSEIPKVFLQFYRYGPQELKRLFHVMDIEGKGHISWSSFLRTVSLGQFAEEHVLAAYMFLVFDQALLKQLNRRQLSKLTAMNQHYIISLEDSIVPQPKYQPEQIVQQLLPDEGGVLTLGEWLKIAHIYFDLSSYRSFFNVFVEQKMERDLAKHFSDWNVFSIEDSQKHVAYLLSFKWFQSWRTYLREKYGQTVRIESGKFNNVSPSLKSFRNFTKRAGKKKQTKGKITIRGKVNLARELNVNNVDLVQSNIGQRPRRISNQSLEGEFKDVLKKELHQNRDYVLVAQKIWTYLSTIYQGSPQFRRTGFGSIELHPKIVKLYTLLEKGRIDYASQADIEVSGYLTMGKLVANLLPTDKVNNSTVFIKALGFPRWVQHTDNGQHLLEITPETFIFLVILQKLDAHVFRKTYLSKQQKEITNINLGDFVRYQDGRKCLFMGKNIEGKYIMHFQKQSYSEDICLMETELVNCCSLIPNAQVKSEGNRKLNRPEAKNLPQTRKISFASSFLQVLLSCKSFQSQISLLANEQSRDDTLMKLININSRISQGKQLVPAEILNLMESVHESYSDFDLAMCADFVNDFMKKLSEQFTAMQPPNRLMEQFAVFMSLELSCDTCDYLQTNICETNFCLPLCIPLDQFIYYEVTFVPFDENGAHFEIEMFGFRLQKDATLKEYRSKLQSTIGLLLNDSYIIAEVQNNNIVKNYNSAKNSATLEQLHLRDADCIFIFELKTSFTQFIATHYSGDAKIQEGQLQVGNFVDCFHQKKGWVFGKILETFVNSYSKSTQFRVFHKFAETDAWESNYDSFHENVCRFPLMSYKTAPQYHLRVVQRLFNQASNEMRFVGMPLVTVLTSWMRWREFHFQIYQQIKRFITEEFIFQDQGSCFTKNSLSSSKKITTKKGKSAVKQAHFREYRDSEKFPFVLHLCDYEGRCAICFKYQKEYVFEGEEATHCEGCKLDPVTPISWQVKVADLLICIDWKEKKRFRSDIVLDNDTIQNLRAEKQQTGSNLEACLAFSSKHITSQDSCCDETSLKMSRLSVSKASQILPIILSRMTQEVDGFKRIKQDHIPFPLDSLYIGGCPYQLFAVTAIEGARNLLYNTYLRAENEESKWLMHHGEAVTYVDADEVKKVCALVLYYKKSH